MARILNRLPAGSLKLVFVKRSRACRQPGATGRFNRPAWMGRPLVVHNAGAIEPRLRRSEPVGRQHDGGGGGVLHGRGGVVSFAR